jgi:hypothetical protein
MKRAHIWLRMKGEREAGDSSNQLYGLVRVVQQTECVRGARDEELVRVPERAQEAHKK